MKYAVLGDIHGNLTALETVLAAIERERVDQILSVGDVVVAGTELLTLEAMKMRNKIRSEVDGTVKAINCTQGKTVEDGAVMGGAGSAVGEALAAAGLAKPLLHLGLPDVFIEHGDPAKLMALQGLDAKGIRGSVEARFAAIIEAARPSLKIVA